MACDLQQPQLHLLPPGRESSILWLLYPAVVQRSEAQRVAADLAEDEDGRVSYSEFILVWKLRALGGL